jgi:tetratricopeptide (TPR) repeat protein
MADWSDLKTRAAGKWQIPLLACSLVALAVAIVRLRSDPVELPPDRAALLLDSWVGGGLYQRTIEVGDRILSRIDLSELARAPIHLHVARAHAEQARSAGTMSLAESPAILDHFRKAAAFGQSLTASDYEHMGRALERVRQYDDALAHYAEALDRGVVSAWALRRHVIELNRDRLASPPEVLDGLLDGLIARLDDEPVDRLELRLWALSEKLDTLQALRRTSEATTLLTRNRARFENSALRDSFSYLECLLFYRSGFSDEAEALLRTVRNRVARTDELYAKTGWLLGRVVLRDRSGPQRPQEALSFFTDVIRQHGSGPYVIASRVGEAEALALLERHAEAIDAYRLAIEDLTTSRPRGPVDVEVLRVSLVVLAESLRQADQLANAIGYSRLARLLVDSQNVERATVVLQQLAQLQASYAEQLEAGQDALITFSDERTAVAARSPAAREVFGDAGNTLLDLARLNVQNERMATQSSWQAAELMARSGAGERAADLFRAFAAEHPGHPQVPRALLRIGQLLHAARKIPDAIDAYRECYRRFPRTIDGARALVPLARCYLAIGADGTEMAEKTLGVVLDESEMFTPIAPEFTDALFLLGDAYARRGAYEDAVSVLQEALDRYPNDPRDSRARFLLADAYRQSGLALKREIAEAQFAGEIEQIRRAYADRLATARDMFGALIGEFEARDPATLSRLETIYLRHAYLYEADCRFENQEYAEALKLYEDAVGLFKEQPAGLAAYVQIINCHVFLGEPAEARAALSRALVLVDAMPQAAFDRSVSPEKRADWKRYFEWLGESELLSPVG